MFKKITPAILVLTVVVGCAKKKSYDTEYRAVEQLTKTSIDIKSKYLYVPMTLGTPREVAAAAPFYQGDEKVVRLEWSKEGLEVLEIEHDDRFTDNDLNDLPVLTIPGEFTKYKCAEDDYGDCTNVEEEDEELATEDKTHFTPDYAELEVKEVNMLDATNIEASGCAELQSTKYIKEGSEISDGVINIELEKTYKLKNSWKCIRRNYFNDKFSYNSFKVRFFYSLIRLDDMVTPGYKKMDYPVTDHDTYGFFKNEKSKLNGDFDSQRKEKEFLLNRWAPERKNNELVYYLSANFSKPKNKMLLDATVKSIEVINKGLVSAKSPFKIKLVKQKMGEKEVSPGDLRFNTLVLIEDPLANGLLGYGPSVSNPYTGEIVQAHVNMYGGVLKSIIRRVYNNAADLSAEALSNGKVKVINTYTVAASAFTQLPDVLAQNIATEVSPSPATENTASMGIPSTNTMIPREEVSFPQRNVRISNDLSLEKMDAILKFKMAEKVSSRMEFAKRLEGGDEHLDELERYIRKTESEEHGINHLRGKHSPEFFPIGNTTKVVYPELLNKKSLIVSTGKLKGSLIRWDDLSESQKDFAYKVVLEKSWMATLIHEFGHNLGLRHNFAGSRDKENFYTIKEAKALGMETSPEIGEEDSKTSGRPAYSSIMDYSFSKFNQLKALGKYDIAALRYAYANEVQLNSKEFVKFETTLTDLEKSISNSVAPLKKTLQTMRESQAPKEEIAALEKVISLKETKNYEFCTDGHAGLSSLCNRFDEGTNLTEVAKFRIKKYNDLYKYRNFRDGRLDFSAYDMSSYVGARSRELHQIRDILEEYETYHAYYAKYGLMDDGCDKQMTKTYPELCKRINDHVGAAKLIGSFFIDILKTPDHLCAIVKEDNPSVIVEYKKLAEIYEGIKYTINHVTTSCFDPAVKDSLAKDKLVVAGENGKFLNGFKDSDPRFKYSTDRAVLGTWSDKVFAMRALFERRWRNGSTDKNHMALIDIPSVRFDAIGIISHYTLGDPIQKPLPFTTEDGAQFTVPYVIGEDYRVEQFEDNFSWIKKYFGMDQSGTSSLVEIAFNQIQKIGVAFGEVSSDKAYTAANMASVRRYGGFMGGPTRAVNNIYYYDDIKDITYAANNDLPVSHLIISTLNGKNFLDSLEKSKVEAVFKRRTNPDAPADMPANHKVFFNFGPDLHKQLIDYAAQGAQIPEGAFIQALGPVNGPIVFTVYIEGEAVMKSIAAIRYQIVSTLSNPEDQAEIKLSAMSLTLLNNFLAGKISPEFLEYYKNQLTRLPSYKRQSNI